MQHHLFRTILTNLAELCHSSKVALYQVKQGTVGEILAALSSGEFFYPNQTIALKGIPLEEVLLLRKQQIYPCILVDDIPMPVYKENYNNFNCLCVPIMLDKRTPVVAIAVIVQDNKQLVDDYALKVLQFINSLLADSLKTVFENQILYKQATIDSLTELYTRHYFEIRIQEEITRARRHGGVFALLILDVDEFKHINAKYGYQEGNRVLQEVAKILNLSIRREIDIPCRHSGNQFSILLPNTDVDGAYILAERIRKRCEQNIFLSLTKKHIKITVSIGVANNIDLVRDIDNDPELFDLGRSSQLSKEELLNRADIMLTAAKQAGRNCVMVWW